jgi:hypothetical protein
MNRGPLTISNEPGGVYVDVAFERPTGSVLGGHMDTNRIFTNVFGGWLTAADKVTAATVHYTKSTVLRCAYKVAQKAMFAAGKTLVEAGYKLTDRCTSK